MKRISYSGGSFLTSDAIADELLALTAELGRIDSSGTVDIPAVSDEGVEEMVGLVIGPASQITSRSELSPYEEPADAASLADLKKRVAALGPARPVHESTVKPPVFDEFDEL